MTSQRSVLIILFVLSLVSLTLCEGVVPKKVGRDLLKEWKTMKSDEQGRIWGITFIACTAFFVAITIFNSNLELSKNHAEIARYEAEISYVDKMTTEIMVCSLQDQKQGIHYFENPIIRKSHDSQLRKTERNLEKKKKNMANLDRDIEDMTERNQKYKSQMAQYKKAMGTALTGGFLGAFGIGGGVNTDAQVTAEIEVQVEDAPLVEVEVAAEVEVEVAVDVEVEVAANVEVEVEIDGEVDGEAPEDDLL
jgi:hypothetical protein